MRVLLVGPIQSRVRLRAELDATPIEIAGEFPTLGAARASAIDADGILVAPRGSDERRDGHDSDDPEMAEPLTPREVQVLERLAEGRLNKAIAEALRISDQTVKFHVASILGKLGAANRTEAVRRAVRGGFITL